MNLFLNRAHNYLSNLQYHLKSYLLHRDKVIKSVILLPSCSVTMMYISQIKIGRFSQQKSSNPETSMQIEQLLRSSDTSRT